MKRGSVGHRPSDEDVIPPLIYTKSTVEHKTHTYRLKNIGSHIFVAWGPTVFPRPLPIFFLTEVQFWPCPWPSTNLWSPQNGGVREQQIVCRSFAQRDAFLTAETHTHKSSRSLCFESPPSWTRSRNIDPWWAKNCWAKNILGSELPSNLGAFVNKLSSYGTSLFVKMKSTENRIKPFLRDMIWLSLNGGKPLAINWVSLWTTSPERLSILTQHAMYSQQPTHCI